LSAPQNLQAENSGSNFFKGEKETENQPTKSYYETRLENEIARHTKAIKDKRLLD